jgi:hypothetical protein
MLPMSKQRVVLPHMRGETTTMAAAQGTIRILDSNGRIRTVNFYLSDASNVLAKFDESKVAVAGSADNYQAKAQCKVIDVCLTSDVATPSSLQILVNGTPTGDILDATAQLASVVTRPNPVIGLNVGDKLQMMQIA